MKRIYVVGLCLVAALAFSSMLASAAQAETAQGQCQELTKGTNPKVKKGVYADSACTTLHEKKGKPDHKGNFEWYPGPGRSCYELKKGEWEAGCSAPASKPHKGHAEKLGGPGFTGTTGPAELKSGAGTIKCAASTAAGEETGLTTNNVVVSFTTCEGPGGAKCTSIGEGTEGNIKTLGLQTTYVGPGEKGPGGLAEPAGGEVWVDFHPESGIGAEKYLAIFACTGVGYFVVEGDVSGVQTGNVNSNGTTSTQTLAEGKAEQNLKTSVCAGPPCKKGGERVANELASAQIATGTTTSATAGEIRIK